MRNVAGVWAAADILNGKRPFIADDRQQAKKQKSTGDGFQEIFENQLKTLTIAETTSLNTEPKETEQNPMKAFGY